MRFNRHALKYHKAHIKTEPSSPTLLWLIPVRVHYHFWICVCSTNIRDLLLTPSFSPGLLGKSCFPSWALGQSPQVPYGDAEGSQSAGLRHNSLRTSRILIYTHTHQFFLPYTAAFTYINTDTSKLRLFKKCQWFPLHRKWESKKWTFFSQVEFHYFFLITAGDDYHFSCSNLWWHRFFKSKTSFLNWKLVVSGSLGKLLHSQPPSKF